MTPAELICARLLTAGCEAAFLGGAVCVWRAPVSYAHLRARETTAYDE